MGIDEWQGDLRLSSNTQHLKGKVGPQGVSR